MTINIGVGGANHQVSAITDGVGGANHTVSKATEGVAGANHDYFSAGEDWTVAVSPGRGSSGSMSAGSTKTFTFSYSIRDPNSTGKSPYSLVTWNASSAAATAGMSATFSNGTFTVTSTQAGSIQIAVDPIVQDANGVQKEAGASGTSGTITITAS